ncbi:type II and III secretion system protein [Gracilimonas mengyeensis]|uniref:Type II and III secretion system protein n=1 Tax=Gracilimonas mengyeensis TaxID=1302730 RepID=A0A521AL24_9BACT|nr:type II and III secretion system protein [Gracilimonas mengyeensis]SMO35492.1 type II and III secretion system protein [Gracilimonas mengyeensis]
MKTVKKMSYAYSTAFALFLCMAVFSTGQQVMAQEIIDPLREYTNPEEVVTFDRNTSYTEAIEVINTFAQEFDDKFIVDNTARSGELGVNLPPMHWKDALRYILRFENLQLTEYEDFYEISVPKEEANVSKQANATGVGQQSEILATTDTREVRINATFFEGNKRALQEIGIDWSTLTSDIPENLSEFVSGEGGETVPSSTLNDQFVAVNSFNASSVSQNAFNAMVNFGEFGPGISVQALFSAFEADNLGKVLATPSIKVVDGQEGNIQVGQDFSIKQRDIAGNVTDNFVSTGTILTVTPNIITQGDTSFIYLDLEVERSTAQPDVVSTIVNKQEATTSAILMDGESTYVAGLYRTEETSVRRGVPILKDLPGWFFGLRYLFGYNSNDYLENELIIIVQAELIEPVKTRISNKLETKRDVLNSTRDRMRNDLDRVFESAESPFPPEDDAAAKSQDSVAAEEEVLEPEVTETETTDEPELTEEQQEMAEELSMPVEHPELMMVVPKAFDLNEFLERQQNGEVVEETDSDLKYFVIGGSFLVPRNAQNFKETLAEEGWDTRILFNPETRFNYVAYEGFSDFDEAVERTLELRGSINDEAWLFTLR